MSTLYLRFSSVKTNCRQIAKNKTVPASSQFIPVLQVGKKRCVHGICVSGTSINNLFTQTSLGTIRATQGTTAKNEPRIRNGKEYEASKVINIGEHNENCGLGPRVGYFQRKLKKQGNAGVYKEST